MLNISFQGERGAYSETAAFSYFGKEISPTPCHNFEDVFLSLENGKSDRGIIPIENSLAGSIHQNYKLLLEHHLHIVGETILRIRHSLIAFPGVSVVEIKKVISHPQALAQCEKFLTGLGVQIEPAYDTAGSVKILKESQRKDVAAVASTHAAEVYGMEVLEEGIEDNEANFTRFLVLSATRQSVEGDCKTSIVFGLPNQPGALFKALKVFADRNLDLTKIESHPIPGRSWEYWFYLDFIGTIDEGNSGQAIDQLKEFATFVRVLGSYRRA